MLAADGVWRSKPVSVAWAAESCCGVCCRCGAACPPADDTGELNMVLRPLTRPEPATGDATESSCPLVIQAELVMPPTAFGVGLDTRERTACERAETGRGDTTDDDDDDDKVDEALAAAAMRLARMR